MADPIVSLPVSTRTTDELSAIAVDSSLLIPVSDGTLPAKRISLQDIKDFSVSDLGTASTLDFGNAVGQLPAVQPSGKLDPSVIPASFINNVYVGLAADRTTQTIANGGASDALVGDVFKETDGLQLTWILQTEPGSNAANWVQITPSTIDWTQIVNTPTTLAGYGITDGHVPATTSTIGEVIIGQGLNVLPDGTLSTKTATPYMARGLTDLVGNPEITGFSGTFWNADGYDLRQREDSNFVSNMPSGTGPWQIYDFDGISASNIRNLIPSDVIDDISIGMTVQIYDDPSNFTYKYLKVATSVSTPSVWQGQLSYFKGTQVISSDGQSYIAIHNVGFPGTQPEADSTNWTLSAYAGGMRVMGGADATVDGYEGIAPSPLAGEQRKALIGDGSWRSVTLAQPVPTDTANPEFAGNIIARISADETKLFIDYRQAGGTIVSKEVGESIAPPAPTNISYTPSPTTGAIGSSTGTGANIPLADSTNSGLFSPAQKTKLASLPTGPITDNLSWSASPTGGVVAGTLGTDATLTLATAVNAGLMAPAQFSSIAQPNTQVVFGTGTGLSSNATLTYTSPTLNHTPITGAKQNWYNAGAAGRFGVGIQTGHVQFYVPTANYFAFNGGGDLNAVGVNERMRIDASTGNVSIGPAAAGRARLDIRMPGALNGTAMASATGVLIESLTTGQNANLTLAANNGSSGGLSSMLQFAGHSNGGTLIRGAQISSTPTDGSTAGTINGNLTFQVCNNSTAGAISQAARIDSTTKLVTGISTGANTTGLQFSSLTSAFSPSVTSGVFLTVDGSGNVIPANIPTAASNYFRGTWTTAGTFPNSGGSGLVGAVQAGDQWYYTGVATTMGGKTVQPGDILMALVNAPGQTGSNWLVDSSNSLGYVAVNKAGDTGVGPIALLGNAVNPLEVTTLQQVQAMVQPTNVAFVPSPTTGTITSSTGSSGTVTLADATNSGLMSPSDFTKLSLYRATPYVAAKQSDSGPSTSKTLANAPQAITLQPFRNGVLMEETVQYTLSGATITYVTPLVSGEKVIFFYRY